MRENKAASLCCCLLFFASLSACSFHPARRVPVTSIRVESENVSPLSIGFATAFEDKDQLCVEGIVDSTEGEHSFLRGSVTATAFSESGAKLAQNTDCFLSQALNAGPRLSRDHIHSGRRFDVNFGITPKGVSKILVVPSVTDVNCK